MASKISILSLVLLVSLLITATADLNTSAIECRPVGICENKDKCRKLCRDNLYDPHAALCTPSVDANVADCCCIVNNHNHN
ncbi:hypothetical protein AMTRI_Chr05g70780 [Amborella trichopoda]